MILREIVRTLERMEQGQRELLERLEERETAAREDKWLQTGIESILSYQVKRKGED